MFLCSANTCHSSIQLGKIEMARRHRPVFIVQLLRNIFYAYFAELYFGILPTFVPLLVHWMLIDSYTYLLIQLFNVYFSTVQYCINYTVAYLKYVVKINYYLGEMESNIYYYNIITCLTVILYLYYVHNNY